MSLLVMPLMGPLQAWSLSGPYRERQAHPVPTKAGVVGLLAGCLGRPRGADVQDLAALALHIRVDRAGNRLRDFQTVRGALRANGKKDDQGLLLYRDYLADAAFLVALAGDAGLLDELHAATHSPVFVPYLGRRSCLPGLPLWHPDGRCDASLQEVFGRFPDLAGTGGRKRVFEEGRGPMTVRDQPLPNRDFTERQLIPRHIEVPA